ncbi:hypothetical protein GTV32_14490 [Gordonia sp. SID5947]|uniref:hypothetical protein n=1 Tax=Gordonia sp. SID5947 TaxID=2690315 RepID=UPI00136E43B6|nr:hypothetical protein [Gordonia sp. SID5947]MYR07438.1 hypothetical protein [Gordonia sp. SID5947]
MGQPSGPPPRAGDRPPPPPDDLYRIPLYPHLYPPLGYAPDGRPIFVPGEPEKPSTAVDGTEAPDSGVLTDEAPTAVRVRSSERRLVGVLALVAVAALGLLAVTVGRASLRDDPPPTADREMPVIITQLPTQTPTAPPGGDTDEMPGAPNSPGSPAGKEIVYEVTASSPTTILYVDADGLRTTIGAPTTWTVSFTGTANPLRVLVLAGDGDAQCLIKVDGRPVAADRISAQSPRRTVSCRA